MTPEKQKPAEKPEENNTKGVVPTEISGEMKKSYLDYAMSVIVSRALPAIEDGLKPVQRRILYSMQGLGLKPNTPTKKSARIVGECLVKDTLVLTTRGLTPIQNINRGDFVYTQNTIQQAEELYEMPEKELLKITLSNGVSATATTSQKFKILNERLEYEWKDAKDLKENEFLVIKADYPELQENIKVRLFNNRHLELNENIAYLLGQFLSDGWIEKSNRICFGTASRTIIERLKTILEKEFQYVANIESRNRNYEASSGQVLESTIFILRINNKSLCNFLAGTFNLEGKKAHTKEIPYQILQSPKKVIYSFLSGLIDGDGSIHKSRNVIQYGSVSEKLIDKFLLITQQLGVIGKKYESELGPSRKFNHRIIKSNYPAMSIEFAGDFARKLAINLNLSEERKSERLKEILSGKLKKSFFEIIPFAGDLIFSELSEKHVGSGWYKDEEGKKFRLGIRYQIGSKIRYSKQLKNLPLRKSQIIEWNILEKLKRINSIYYRFVKETIDNKVYFLQIKKIDKANSEKTYDIGVKNDHEFIANSIVVHNCLGKYHPHGDVAVYDAMVRMAQDFSLRYPLVFGQGNFGSIDNDPPAAQRYTEARLMPMAMELLQDIDKDTVKFLPNFDNSLKEPELLPGKLPALILNGASGIAVGMATNIPPHNLTEVCDAIIAYIKNSDIGIDELINIVTAPDFPTGGSVSGDMKSLYTTGKGQLILRGKTSIETIRNREAIVITEIPYMLNKTSLIEQIASLVQKKKLRDIADLRDESSKGKIRVVLELRKGSNPKMVINSLYKYTRLQDSFNVNFLALVKGQPQLLGLRDVLREYVEYRKKIITLRTKYDLKKAEERIEIVQGLLIALKNIDEVIMLIKKSRGAIEAFDGLIKKFKLTKRQAQAILETRLQQLTSLEQDKLKKENDELKGKIEEFRKILGDIKEVLKIITKEVSELKRNYGDQRRTQVLQRISEISERDIIQEKDVVVTITEKGYCKRMDIQSYKEQKRGGRGVIGSNLATGDFVKQLITCSTHDYLMFFTTKGRVLWLKAYDVPEAERYSKGKALANLLSLKDESIANVISVNKFDDFLFMVTRRGIVKKISLLHFSNPRASGIRAINLPASNGDSVMDVQIVKKGEEVLLATTKGQAIRFNSDDVRDMGRASYGVAGIRLEKGDEVVSLEVLRTGTILTITKKGFGKRTEVSAYRKTARAGKGVINLKVSERTGDVVTTVSVNPEESIIITTAKGMVIRTSLKNIRIMGRAAQGVRIVKLAPGDTVTDLVKVPDAIGNGEE